MGHRTHAIADARHIRLRFAHVAPAPAVPRGMRAAPEADPGAVGPVLEIVAAPAARLGHVGDLVLGVPRGLEAVERRQVHLGRDVVRRLRPAAPSHVLPQGGVRIELEQVERGVLGVEADQNIEGLTPVFEGLLRQPDHQIDADVVEPGGPGRLERLDRARRGMHAAESAQLRVPERLHAEAETGHPGGPVALEPLPRRGLGVHFEGDFRRRIEREARAAAGDEGAHVTGSEHRRGASAEEHGVHAPAVPRRLDLSRQRDEIPAFRVAPEQPPVEVAVVADRLAEWNVKVEAKRNGGRAGIVWHDARWRCVGSGVGAADAACEPQPPARPPDQPSSVLPVFRRARAREDVRVGNLRRGLSFQRRVRSSLLGANSLTSR